MYTFLSKGMTFDSAGWPPISSAMAGLSSQSMRAVGITGAQFYQDRDGVNDIADGGRLDQQNPLERLLLKRLIQGPSPRRAHSVRPSDGRRRLSISPMRRRDAQNLAAHRSAIRHPVEWMTRADQ